MQHLAQSKIASCFILLSFASVQIGCTAKLPPEAARVTIVTALGDLGEGLSKMRANIGKEKTGLIPSEVEVTFKLTAAGSGSNSLGVDLSPTESFAKQIAPSASAKFESSQQTEKINAVTIKFKNVAFGTTTTKTETKDKVVTVVVDGLADGDAISKTLDALRKEGITTYSPP